MGVGPSLAASGRIRRSNSWAVEDSSKLADRSLSRSFRLQLQCAVHELGTQRGCRSENYLQQRGYGALVGLHSNWIGHFILASARPTNRLLDEHHIIYQVCETTRAGQSDITLCGQLHSQHIGAVINLQEPGEHSGCGDGVLQNSGFSYTPERFMEKDIFYFNFPMKDTKALESDYMLDICHTIDSQIAAGEKVMVHCHSGCGRTGLVVACYFLYSGAYEDPMEAIQAIQTDREGTFRKTYQVTMVKNFDVYLKALRLHFVSPDKIQKRSGVTPGYPNIPENMRRQKKILHGLERRALLHVPKIVDWTTRELIRRTEFNRQKREKMAAAFMLAFTTPRSKVDITKAKEKINNADWGGVEEVEASVLCNLLLEWLWQLQEPIVPDAIVTTALGRGDIESAIAELSKADKCSFATIQILACFIFQIVPVKPKLIRQLYSALAHVMLINSSLQSTKLEDIIAEEPAAAEENGQATSSKTRKKQGMSISNTVYTKYKPTLLEIEYGLLLEASARFWIKLGKAKHAGQESTRKSKSSTSSSSPRKENQPIISQLWFRERASLQIEQYNPMVDALQHRKDLDTLNDESSSTSSKTFTFVQPTPPTTPKRKV